MSLVICPACSTPTHQDKRGARWCQNRDCEATSYLYRCRTCETWVSEDEIDNQNDNGHECRACWLARDNRRPLRAGVDQ